MPPNIEIYIGSPIQVQSEREFLDRLSSDPKAAQLNMQLFGRGGIKVDIETISEPICCFKNN